MSFPIFLEMNLPVLLAHFLLGIPAALLIGNATEWLVHKYVLHGAGKRKKSFWHFHWYDHHQHSRKHRIDDPDYGESLLGKWNGQSKEAVALFASGLVLSPLTLIAPGLGLGLIYCHFNYYHRHKKSHLDQAWARKHLPWHMDHHLGRNQEANWCVTRPWFDHLLGTREPYLGTEMERRDLERIAARQASHALRKSSIDAGAGPA